MEWIIREDINIRPWSLTPGASLVVKLVVELLSYSVFRTFVINRIIKCLCL